MKKILITSFAVAAMAIGGGVFVHTALVQSDPILEANVEALSRGESSIQIQCDMSSVVIICQASCFSCGRLYRAVSGYGRSSGLRGECVCGKSY